MGGDMTKIGGYAQDKDIFKKLHKLDKRNNFMTVKRKFKIVGVAVSSWHTEFSIKDYEHENNENKMSPEAFFHHIGGLCGKELEEINGLEFEVVLPVKKVKKREDDSLDLCGKIIGGNRK
jgi:hypothetical protein